MRGPVTSWCYLSERKSQIQVATAGARRIEMPCGLFRSAGRDAQSSVTQSRLELERARQAPARAGHTGQGKILGTLWRRGWRVANLLLHHSHLTHRDSCVKNFFYEKNDTLLLHLYCLWLKDLLFWSLLTRNVCSFSCLISFFPAHSKHPSSSGQMAVGDV